jgi:Tfp pilus assembly PilM family ATPase
MPTTLNRPSRVSVRSPRVGWIGVDLGTHAVKLAQVERLGGQWNIRNRIAIPLDEGTTLDADSLRGGVLADLLNRQLARTPALRPRPAACSLPMTLSEYRCLQLPQAADEELEQMVKQELATLSDGPLTSRRRACWPSGSTAASPGAIQEVSVLSIDDDLSGAVAEQLLARSLNCQVIDGVPFALARAAEMVYPHRTERPTAALDWGYTTAVLVVAQNGYPRFTRVLRGCGIGSLMADICQAFQLSLAQSNRLLQLLPEDDQPSPDLPADVAQAAEEIIRPHRDKLVHELRRTLRYVRQLDPKMMPAEILLMGGGSGIAGSVAHLQAAVGCPVELWQLNRAASSQPTAAPRDALFAQALALSALGCDA